MSCVPPPVLLMFQCFSNCKLQSTGRSIKLELSLEYQWVKKKKNQIFPVKVLRWTRMVYWENVLLLCLLKWWVSELPHIFSASLFCELLRWVVCSFGRSAEWPGWTVTCSSWSGSLKDSVNSPRCCCPWIITKNQRAILPSNQLT